MLAARVVANNAIEKEILVKPYVKKSLYLISGVVSKYLETANVLPFLQQLDFSKAGYGFMTW